MFFSFPEEREKDTTVTLHQLLHSMQGGMRNILVEAFDHSDELGTYIPSMSKINSALLSRWGKEKYKARALRSPFHPSRFK